MTQNTLKTELEIKPWLRRNSTIALALFALALAVRLLYLIELSGTPYWDFLLVDSKSYHEIATGSVSWNTWLAPLYGWMLRLIYITTGSDLWVPRLLQAIIGSVLVILVYLSALRIGGKTVGIIAGIVSALYLPHIFYGAHLMKASWATFFLFLGFFLLLKWRDLLENENRKELSTAVLCFTGASLGIGVLFRGNILILIPFIFVWVLVILLRKTKSAAALAPLFLAAFIIWPTVIIAASSFKEKSFVGLTTSAGFNFFEGNSEYATGYHADIPGFPRTAQSEQKSAAEFASRETGPDPGAARVDQYYRNTALGWIANHPQTWLFGLKSKKLYYFFNRLEIPDNYSYTFMAERSILLRVPLIGQWLIAPLAIAGIILFWPRRETGSQPETGKKTQQAAPLYGSTLLYIFTLGYMLAVIVFYVTGRMRLGAAPFLIIFASLFVVEIIKRIRTRIKTAIPWLIILTIACVFVWWPAPPSTLGYDREHFVLATYAAQKAEKARKSGDMQQSIEAYDTAVKEYENALQYSSYGGREILHENILSISNTIAEAYRKAGGDPAELKKWDERVEKHKKALDKFPSRNKWKYFPYRPSDIPPRH
ncbi:MAG: ArnT family glycosyltransferase [Planctomycetota bacterium]